MSSRTIPMEHYPRRAHFDYFRTLPYPYVGVTQAVDVTELVRFCREKGISFFLAVLHAAALAANGIPEFRQRIRNGEIIEYDECPTSHTEPLENGTYCYCTVRHHFSLAEYLARAEEARQRSRAAASIAEDEDVESMLFITCLPWLHYSALIQPVAGGDESNPRISWGKYEADAQGRLMLPVTVLAHHALVDGLQLGQFYEKLHAELLHIYHA